MTPSPPAAPATPDVLAQVVRLKMAIGRLDRRLRQQSNTTLNPTQLSVFGTIHVHGPISLTDLAAQERLSAPTISKTVASLEEHGLVERIRDQHDRRVWHVRVTAAGERWAAGRRAERNTWLAQRFNELSPDEQAALLAALPVLEHLVDVDD